MTDTQFKIIMNEFKEQKEFNNKIEKLVKENTETINRNHDLISRNHDLISRNHNLIKKYHPE